jgi:tight adherence protein B
VTGVLFAALFVATGLYAWQGVSLRRRTVERLAAMMTIERAVEQSRDAPRKTIQSFRVRHRYLPPVVGIAAAAILSFAVGLPLDVSAAAGARLGVMAHLGEEYRGDQQASIIEAQLATAIYLMVGSLRAGASLLSAFDSALEEVGPPLRPYFQEVAGRIRLGDDPRAAVSDLQVHVPLETFRLFATSLAIHWEVGGSLATTLSTVGRTVRDRIELARRVRAQSVEAHASVGVVLLITYVLGFLMWRTNPDRLNVFLASNIGTTVVAGVIAMQAVGLIWMSRLNKAAF